MALLFRPGGYTEKDIFHCFQSCQIMGKLKISEIIANTAKKGIKKRPIMLWECAFASINKV